MQVLVLAGPGVMAATIMMAVFSKYVFPYDWDWNTCLFFGAMTSATDPVAVVALMKVTSACFHVWQFAFGGVFGCYDGAAGAPAAFSH